jgi:glycosyl transferase family 1
VIKSINHEHHLDAHERLLLAAAEHPDIEVMDRYVSASEKNSMLASADCYVSLHRAEGFGLTPAESLCMGKPVIATRYGGNLEFMNDRNSWLVDYELVPIGYGNDPYPATGEWADPDVDQAASYMREMLDRPGVARERARRGIADMRDKHAPQAAGRSMRRRLEHVYARHPQWPRRVQRELEQPNLSRLEELVAAGPPPPAGKRLGAARRLVRRLTLRMIKPFTTYQRSVNSELLQLARAAALSASRAQRDLRRERTRAAQRTAVQLAELRRQSAQIEDLPDQLQRVHGDLAETGADADVNDARSRLVEETTEALTGLGG